MNMFLFDGYHRKDLAASIKTLLTYFIYTREFHETYFSKNTITHVEILNKLSCMLFIQIMPMRTELKNQLQLSVLKQKNRGNVRAAMSLSISC